jgi:serine/threonine protein kinase
MSTPQPCPPADRLRRLLADQLPPPEQAELTAHLDGCTHCQMALETLAVGGDMSQALTLPHGGPPPAAEPDLLRALEQLRAQPGQAVRRPGPREQWVLSVLAPSAAGNLGKLGDYEVLEVIGQGGMGIVLKALDPALRRHVAIKVLAPHLADDSSARRRFAREAQTAAAVHHENVVTIHAVNETGPVPYLVMEYVPGGSLQEYLDRHGKLDVRSVVRVGAQAAAGLAAAHAQGVVHRDIKPANILIRIDPHSAILDIKIGDFGLARAADETCLTQSGVVAGTPMYMAPEQALGEAVGPRADLFSLGTVLYTLCAGRPPFKPGAPMAVLRQVCDVEPPPVTQFNPQVPAWLAEVIAALHVKNPEQRFPSAAALAELLRQHLAHLEDPALVPRPPDTSRHLRPLRRSSRWTRAVRWVAVAALAAVVVLGLWLWLREPAPRLTLDNQSTVRAVAFSPDGSTLATGGDDYVTKLWSATDGRLLHSLEAHRTPVVALAFQTDGDLLAEGSKNGTIRLWKPSTLRDLGVYRGKGDRALSTLRALAFAPDGKTLAVGYDKYVELLAVDDGKVVGPRTGAQALAHPAQVLAIAWRPDGQALVSADEVGNLKVWRADGSPQPPLPAYKGAVHGLAFRADGLVLAVGGADRSVRLLEWTTARQVGALPVGRDEVMAVAFAPRGGVLACATRDGLVQLWDSAGDYTQPLVTLPKQSGAVRALAFSPDGNSLATAGEGGLVRVWDVGRWTATR